MPAPSVHTERRGHVLVVTIDRPEAKNAVDAATAEAICAAMDELDATQELFLGIVTGAGGVFSAGADIKAAARGEKRATSARGPFGFCEAPPKKPLIAAVEGLAYGGGFEMCLACDLIVVARDAKFALPEVRHNLVALGGGAIRLAKRLPFHLAMELALTGEPFGAERLHAAGFVNVLTEAGGALQGALEMSDRLLRNGPTALAATVQLIRGTDDWTEAEAWAQQRDIAAPALNAEDRAEGLAAFVEKRKPEWKGR